MALRKIAIRVRGDSQSIVSQFPEDLIGLKLL